MSEISHITRAIAALRPGQHVTISRLLMKDVRSPMTLADGPEWILEGIVGSAYTIGFREDPTTGNVTFHRLKESLEGTDLRTFVSADRKDRFEPHGALWKVKRP